MVGHWRVTSYGRWTDHKCQPNTVGLRLKTWHEDVCTNYKGSPYLVQFLRSDSQRLNLLSLFFFLVYLYHGSFLCFHSRVLRCQLFLLKWGLAISSLWPSFYLLKCLIFWLNIFDWIFWFFFVFVKSLKLYIYYFNFFKIINYSLRFKIPVFFKKKSLITCQRSFNNRKFSYISLIVIIQFSTSQYRE